MLRLLLLLSTVVHASLGSGRFSLQVMSYSNPRGELTTTECCSRDGEVGRDGDRGTREKGGNVGERKNMDDGDDGNSDGDIWDVRVGVRESGGKTRNNGGVSDDGRCPEACRTFFKLCLHEYQTRVTYAGACTFGNVTSGVIADRTLSVRRGHSNATLVLPFDFTWTVRDGN